MTPSLYYPSVVKICVQYSGFQLLIHADWNHIAQLLTYRTEYRTLESANAENFSDHGLIFAIANQPVLEVNGLTYYKWERFR